MFRLDTMLLDRMHCLMRTSLAEHSHTDFSGPGLSRPRRCDRHPHGVAALSSTSDLHRQRLLIAKHAIDLRDEVVERGHSNELLRQRDVRQSIRAEEQTLCFASRKRRAECDGEVCDLGRRQNGDVDSRSVRLSWAP